MSFGSIFFSFQFLKALFVYAVLIAVVLPLMDRVHARLQHSVLQWKWDHIAMPLSQAGLLVLFILMAYPVIYGIENAPTISSLLSQDDLRINYLVNLIFVVSLLFPLLPVIGHWHELILPLQGVAASALVFSWLAPGAGLDEFSYWPGWEILLACLVLGFLAHWLGVRISVLVGHKLDKTFNVLDSGELFSRALIMLLQSPVVLLFSASLGKQLQVG